MSIKQLCVLYLPLSLFNPHDYHTLPNPCHDIINSRDKNLCNSNYSSE